MAEEPSRPKLRLSERAPAPSPAPAAPPPTPERVFRAPALPVPGTPAVKLPPPPPPAAAAPAGRPPLRVAERPAAPAAAPLPPPAERSSVLPLVGALVCVVGAALFYTQVLRPRREAREAREAAAAAATPAAPSPAAAPAASAPGPEASVPAVLERADPGASAEFRARVTNLRLSGVFEGEPSRAMIDGRLVRAGEVIDERLGVRFDGLEPGRRLRFRDATGATVVRKY